MNDAKVQQAMEQAVQAADVADDGVVTLPMEEWLALVTSVFPPTTLASLYNHGDL